MNHLEDLTPREQSILVWFAQKAARNPRVLAWLKTEVKKREEKTSFQRFAFVMDTAIKAVVITALVVVVLVSFRLINPPRSISADWPEAIQQWSRIIVREATKNDLDPNLVAAIILQESGGNPTAYSEDGAVGLMQVMPSDGIASTFQCPNGPCFSSRPTAEELYDPKFNVSYGTRMLAGLIEKNGGNIREALKDYGPAGVGYTYSDIVLGLYQKYGHTTIVTQWSESNLRAITLEGISMLLVPPSGLVWPGVGVTVTGDSSTHGYPATDFGNGGVPFDALAVCEGQVFGTIPSGLSLKCRDFPGLEFRYYHLADDNKAVLGQQVVAGQFVGVADGSLGSGGSSTGPHLHLEAIRDGVLIDPVIAIASGGGTNQSPSDIYSAIIKARNYASQLGVWEWLEVVP